MTNIYKFKTKPYAHQVKALKKILKEGTKRGGGLPMEMGTGKTKVAIDYAGIKEQLGEVTGVIVLAPLSVLGVWDRQIDQHSGSKTLDWISMNYDKVWRQHYFEILLAFIARHQGKVLLVCDESHQIKNPTAKRTKGVTVLAQHVALMLWLSGTPITKHPLDLFAPMKALDEAILGGSWAVFRRSYAVWGGYGGNQLIKYIGTKQLMHKVRPHVFAIKKEDCLDLPSKTHTIIPVVLGKSRKTYDTLARESIVEFEELEVETPIVLTRLLRLSQLTGGFLVGQDGSRRVGTEKIDAFTELAQTMYDSDRTHLVVFTRFLADLAQCGKALHSIGYSIVPFHGGVKPAERDRRLARFDEAVEPTAFVAQIATGSLGISLTAASDAIFFSHDYRYDHFAQACDRLHRIGQFHPVNYYHLLTKDTVDEAVWLALRTKRSLAQLVFKRPELIIES